ncbi:MAG: hypothetical protein ACRDDY_17740 [Clostridium sp.]|uniref:hypothetical protein n=1 Tax=Clostridium sp. TaxID=1506 RepID=UPI003EE72089
MRGYYIYVVLTRTNSGLSNVIKLVTGDTYTHAAISLDKNLNEMYGFSRKYTHNPFIGVLKKEDVTKGLYKHQKRLLGRIIEIKVSKEEYRKFRVLFQEYIDNSYKYKYNTKGLVYGLLKKEKDIKDRFLCSEFVYHVLKESGIIDWDKPANLVRPQELAELLGNSIYEGDLKERRLNYLGKGIEEFLEEGIVENKYLV